MLLLLLLLELVREKGCGRRNDSAAAATDALENTFDIKDSLRLSTPLSVPLSDTDRGAEIED